MSSQEPEQQLKVPDDVAAGSARQRLVDGTPITKSSGGALMSATTTARLRAAIVALAPLVVLAAHVYHPQIGNPTDADFLPHLAEAVAASTMRWGVSHLMLAVGSGLLALAFLAIRSYLREAGEERWSGPALPFIVMGSTLYTMLPAMEFASLAAAQIGADIQAAQAALIPWFAPILVTGGVIFLLGAIGFALGIVRSGILSSPLTWLVVGALIVMAASRLAPIEVVQFYVHGAAGILALWPLAYWMWEHPAARVRSTARGRAT